MEHDNFRGWDFGSELFARLAWEENPEEGIIAQQMIQEIMPLGFIPHGKTHMARFRILARRIKGLTAAGRLEEHIPWLHEMIRLEFIEGHQIDPEFNYAPPLILELSGLPAIRPSKTIN